MVTTYTTFLHSPPPPYSTTSHTTSPSKPKPTHLHLTFSSRPKTTTTKAHQSKSQTPLSHLTNLLWGKSLPPTLLISTVRYTWTTIWQIMMAQLAPSDPKGNYKRPNSNFPLKNINQLSLQKEPNFYHLYVGKPCPWAHRALIVWALKGLEKTIPLSFCSPGVDGLWVLSQDSRDSALGCRTLKEVYKLRKDGYDGRATVPMLWDRVNNEVVCNESYDIIKLFNSGFNDVAENKGLDLEPEKLRERIEGWNRIVYPNVNNGVYRCGFAQTQQAYDAAVTDLFSTLDMIEDHLKASRYLCGDSLTLADVCLFTTLIRFDLVYNVMFKCTKKKLVEYPNLHGYMRDIYQIPKVAQTCDLDAMMDGYYKFLFPLNPGNIRPVMPSGCTHEALSKPHGRESLSSADKAFVTSVS